MPGQSEEQEQESCQPPRPVERAVSDVPREVQNGKPPALPLPFSSSWKERGKDFLQRSEQKTAASGFLKDKVK